MNQIVKISRAINDAFIKVILFFFYYIVIGVVSVFYRLFKPRNKAKNTYWSDIEDRIADKNYFNSPY